MEVARAVQQTTEEQLELVPKKTEDERNVSAVLAKKEKKLQA